MGAFLALVNVALLHVGAGRPALLAYTPPLWVTPAAIVLLGERPTAFQLLGLAPGFAGVAVLFVPLGFDWAAHPWLLGNCMLPGAGPASRVAHRHIRPPHRDSTPFPPP